MMWERYFGWSKASKCKALVKIVISRVRLLRNKRNAIVKQQRLDIAQLLRNNKLFRSFKRVELLCKEQNLLDRYDMVELFCECILERLSYIRRHKDCPPDINESVSSLIFASARCADLPELQRLRILFAKRYGYEFASSAVELGPDSCVNQQIIDNLSVGSPNSDLKLSLMEGIVTEFNIQWDFNIQVELGKPTTDPLLIDFGEWEKFKSCNNGVNSSCHPFLRTLYINGNGNTNKSFDTIKEQESEYSNIQNDTLPGYSGHENQIFERDIPVVSSSVKEICSIPVKIAKTSGIEKQEPSPSEKCLKSGSKNLGTRSAGQKFLKGTSVDSCRVDILNSDDLGYNSANVAEPEATAASVAANLSKFPKPPREGSIFDISENDDTRGTGIFYDVWSIRDKDSIEIDVTSRYRKARKLIAALFRALKQKFKTTNSSPSYRTRG